MSYTELRPVGDTNQNWVAIASSSNGAYIIVSNYLRLYLSSDYGATWSEVRPVGDLDKSWSILAMDGDGSFIVAGIHSGRLYISTDYGATWTESQPYGAVDVAWSSISCDSDGSHIIACSYLKNNVSISTDSGSSWTLKQYLGLNYPAILVACDSDGSRFLACPTSSYLNGNIYMSTDSGVTWSNISPVPTLWQDWTDFKLSKDGTKIICCSGNYDGAGGYPYGGKVYYSSDSGSTWTELTPAGAVILCWTKVHISEDGYLAAQSDENGILEGRIYISADWGATWSEAIPAGDLSLAWLAGDMSKNNSIFYIGAYGGRLYKTIDVLSDLYGIPSSACFLPINEDEMIILGKHRDKDTHIESLVVTEFQGNLDTDGDYLYEDELV